MLARGLVIRRGALHDAAALAALGARTFAETFGADNTPEDLRLYLANTYAEPLQQAELTDPDMRTLLVENGDNLVAFAQIRRGLAPTCVALPYPVEIWRFYVDRSWHGRGVAQTLMDAALAAARELGGRSAWLSVWERNSRAIAFYAKQGFAEMGSKVFVLGTDHQTDKVMAREIATTPSV